MLDAPPQADYRQRFHWGGRSEGRAEPFGWISYPIQNGWGARASALLHSGGPGVGAGPSRLVRGLLLTESYISSHEQWDDSKPFVLLWY